MLCCVKNMTVWSKKIFLKISAIEESLNASVHTRHVVRNFIPHACSNNYTKLCMLILLCVHIIICAYLERERSKEFDQTSKPNI